jgi:hypothetical protein
MGKSKGQTTETTGPDEATLARMRQLWSAAQTAGTSPGYGVNPLTTDAASGFGGIAKAGNLGFGALSGDPNAVKSLMDPYQANVIDKMNEQYGLDRTGTMRSVNDAATTGGAFGGSRHGVAEGVALGELERNHGQAVASQLDTGFNNAMGRAGTLANLGFGANGALASLGEYMRNVDVQNDPNMRQFQSLLSAFGAMPHGSTTTGTKQDGHNGASGALGGALAGGSMFGPWGALGGGLLGMFS